MQTITLGPKGTYSELASHQLLTDLNLISDIKLYSSIDLCFTNFRESMVLPFDNSIDGYVQRTLDLLYERNLFITHQTKLPISFSLVSNEANINDIETIYVQFKAHNQCLNFLSKFSHFNYITTDSNVSSLNEFLKNEKKSAAIIPTHLISSHFELIIHQIHDTLDNTTRFAFIENKLAIPNSKSIKSMIVLSPNDDKPGLLHDILLNFKSLNINLTSIISRPKKSHPGVFNFFIEIGLNRDNYKELVYLLNKNPNFKTTILGVYI